MKTRKNDFSDLTFCIPVRIDSDKRKRNILAVVNFYRKETNARFIILEADNERKINELTLSPSLHYFFIKDDNLIFHRTHYINRMLNEVETSFAVIWDADVVIPTEQLAEAYMKLKLNNRTMVYPYDGRFCCINDFFSALFCKKNKIGLFTKTDMSQKMIFGYYSVGGAYVVNVQSYRTFGWENENFIGWGPEDVERNCRMRILGDCPERVGGPLFHLHHTRSVNSGDYMREVAFTTKKVLCHVCGMTSAELKEYVKTWSWIK